MNFGCRVFVSFVVCAAIALLSGCEQKDALPNDSREALKIGWARLGSAEYERAEEAFRRALERAAPNSRDALLAKFGLASTYQSTKPTARYEEATRTYEELAAADKGGDIGAWSALAIVRMQHLKLYEVGHGGTKTTLPATAELDVVRNNYTELIANYPNTDAADEAALYVGSSYIAQVDTVNIDNGIAYLDAWIKTHGHSAYLSHAYELVSSGYEIEARDRPELWRNVVETLIDAVKVNANARPDEQSAAFYRIARIAELKTNQPEIAKEYYWKLKKLFPTDPRIYYCNRALISLGEKVTDIPPDDEQNGGAK